MFFANRVSVLSPCYNAEKYIHRLLESVLNQTYQDIELIIINDGSTDQTEKVIYSYKKQFEEQGIIFKYIYQSNKGQAAAINEGLKLFTGEFLTWPDSDDWMTDDCIETKVKYLKENPSIGIVVSKIGIVSENKVDEVSSELTYRDTKNPWIFNRVAMIDKGIFYAPIGYMVRSEYFLKTVPSRQIYANTRGGQNLQILLPISYEYKCGFIDCQLGFYLMRENSHSHSKNSFSEQIRRVDDSEDILINTVARMKIAENKKRKIIKKCLIKFSQDRISLAIKMGDKTDIVNVYNSVISKTNKDFLIKFSLFYYRMVHFMIKLKERIRENVSK